METSPVPDGGRAGWIAVFTVWMKAIVWTGLLKGLGLMLPTIQDQFDTTTWIIGWIASMILAFSGLIGPFSGLVGRYFGTGAVIMVCGVMIGSAAIVGSFTTSPLQFACVLTLLAGGAFGVSDVLSRAAVGRYFDKNYGKASGIARTGYSIGLIACAPLIQFFLSTYGWRGSMLIIGGISLHLVVCGALLVTSERGHKNTYQQVASDEFTAQQTNIFSRCVAGLQKNLDTRLLGSPRYWALAVIVCNPMVTYEMWVVYFVSQAQSVGFTIEEAATFVTVAGVASLVSKLIQGFIVDRGTIPYWVMLGLAFCISSASFCATPWLTSYWAMMTSSCLLLMSDGVLSSLFDVLTKQVLGADLLAGAVGWMGLTVMIMSFSLGFLPGWIYDTTGSYEIAFIFLGSMQFVTIIPLLALRYFKCFE